MTAWLEAPARLFARAARRLVRSPVFSITAVLTLALGIGATTAVFSIVDGVLLRPLPYVQPSRLVDLSHSIVIHGASSVDQSDATYLYYRRANHVFTDVGAYRTEFVNLSRSAGALAERVEAVRASASLFHVLGVAPARGRAFRDDEDLPSAAPVVILGERLWREHYGADPHIVGREVSVDGVQRQVVGIMPAWYAFPDEGAALWLPIGIDPARTASAAFDFHAVARLEPGVTDAAAARDLAALLPHVPEVFPGRLTAPSLRAIHMTPVVRPLSDVLVAGAGRRLWVVLGAGAFLLLVACANVANLFVARAEERQHELAVCRSLGAGRGAIVSEHLAEGVLISVAGGVLGVLLSVAGLVALRALAPAEVIPRLGEATVNGAMLAVAAAVTLLTALAMSVVPALHTLGAPVAEVLRSTGARATAGRTQHRARRALVVVQVAVALVLVTGAGLMVRSFAALRDVQPGFDPAHAYTFRVSLPAATYPGTNDITGFATRALDALSAIPGVRAAGIMTKLPLDAEAREDTAVFPDAQRLAMGQMPDIHQVVWTTPGVFPALGIRIVQGRAPAQADSAHAPLEAVVTSAFARRYWGDGSAVGHTLRLAPTGPQFIVVGVTSDVRGSTLDGPPDETVYLPFVTAPGNAETGGRESAARWAPRNVAFVLRTAAAPEQIAQPVARVLQDIAPTLPAYRVRTMADVVARSTARTSFTLELLEIASLAALAIGAVGLYCVVSYLVSLRAREMAIRLALGAAPAGLRRLVLRQGLAVAGLGIVVGLGAAALLTRTLAKLLFGVGPMDPLTLLGAAAVMAGVALAASWLPARRAAASDPAAVLRADV